MFKNVASQKIALFAYDSTTGAPKTGDAANLTPYVSKDYGTVTVLGTTTATEMDATNAKGWYSFVLTQAETNGDALLFTGKSSTANAFIVGQLIFTDPASFTSFVTPTNLTAAQIATGVWQDATGADFTTASSIGKSLYTTGNAPGAASGLALVGSNMGTITGALTAAQIATGIWQDATAGDFTTASSIGKSVYNAFTSNTSVFTAASLVNSPSGLTGAAIATAVWQDATAGDFTTASSIGKSLYTTGNAPGAASGIALVGSNVGTATSVSGAVGSVTGNVGGNVVGSVGSVAAAVTANTTQIAGSTTAATALSNSTLSICWGTCSGGTTVTAVVSILNNPSSLTDVGQLIGRTIIFLGNSSTPSMDAQASNITNSTTGATPTITFTAMTHAPANGDTFVIV